MSLVSVTDSLHISLRTMAHEPQAVTVDFDATVAAQAVLFVLLLLVLKPLLFDPMLKLFEEREKRIIGAKLQARRLDEASAGALAKYEAEMQRARAVGNTERDRMRAEGSKQENEILAKVRQSTSKTLEEGRKKLAGEVATVRTSLGREASALGRELAGRVLGRQVGE
jgi:F-type H+-transporting ATPase subunit b